MQRETDEQAQLQRELEQRLARALGRRARRLRRFSRIDCILDDPQINRPVAVVEIKARRFFPNGVPWVMLSLSKYGALQRARRELERELRESVRALFVVRCADDSLWSWDATLWPRPPVYRAGRTNHTRPGDRPELVIAIPWTQFAPVQEEATDAASA